MHSHRLSCDRRRPDRDRDRPGRDIAAFAPAALDSLRAQTESRWRAILIDDGSTDDTGAIFDAAAAADDRFTTIRHAASRGLGAARNIALDLVDTPYLGFLETATTSSVPTRSPG